METTTNGSSFGVVSEGISERLECVRPSIGSRYTHRRGSTLGISRPAALVGSMFSCSDRCRVPATPAGGQKLAHRSRQTVELSDDQNPLAGKLQQGHSGTLSTEGRHAPSKLLRKRRPGSEIRPHRGPSAIEAVCISKLNSSVGPEDKLCCGLLISASTPGSFSLINTNPQIV